MSAFRFGKHFFLKMFARCLKSCIFAVTKKEEFFQFDEIR